MGACSVPVTYITYITYIIACLICGHDRACTEYVLRHIDELTLGGCNVPQDGTRTVGFARVCRPCCYACDPGPARSCHQAVTTLAAKAYLQALPSLDGQLARAPDLARR